MGNRPLGTNCGNTTWTRDCCGDVIGYQEICRDLEYCDHLETAGDIRRFCSIQEGTFILIFVLCCSVVLGCYFSYKRIRKISQEKQISRQLRASESEVKSLLDDSFKL